MGGFQDQADEESIVSSGQPVGSEKATNNNNREVAADKK
jgi:hypothetical protein